ncbi:MAG: TNT domain-containing protein [Nitrospira sp.]|nr:TNT domain-containing protein [Nitrospira sp.]
MGEPGATASQRGMARGSEGMPYTQYRVLKPFEALVGPASPVPAFGATGGATQYLTNRTIQQLLREGYLEVIK